MDFVTEKLIEAVQKHPYLYNIRHVDSRNHKRKAEAWKEISVEIGVMDDEILKKRWRSLRDCYRRYKSANKNYDNWIWASRMCFLDPIMNYTSTETDTYTGKVENYEEPSEIQIENDLTSLEYCNSAELEQNTDNVQSISKFRRRRRAQKLPSRKKKISHFEKVDRTDQLFLSYADTFKTLSRRRRALVKLQIAKIFAHAELQDMEDAELGETSPKNTTMPIETVLTPVYSTLSDIEDSCNSSVPSDTLEQ